jgi:nitrogen fixation protein FixH
VTVTLGQTPPPRALAEPPAAARAEAMTIYGQRAAIEVRHDGAAPTTVVRITLTDRHGRPLHAEEAHVRLASPSLGVAPLTRPAVERTPGRYEAEPGLRLPPGAWVVRIDARLGEFDELVLEAEIHVP